MITVIKLFKNRSMVYASMFWNKQWCHVDDRLADWHPHISNEHNRRKNRKGLILITHSIQSTKNYAKEEPWNSINYCSIMHEINEGK